MHPLETLGLGWLGMRVGGRGEGERWLAPPPQFVKKGPGRLLSVLRIQPTLPDPNPNYRCFARPKIRMNTVARCRIRRSNLDPDATHSFYRKLTTTTTELMKLSKYFFIITFATSPQLPYGSAPGVSGMCKWLCVVIDVLMCAGYEG